MPDERPRPPTYVLSWLGTSGARIYQGSAAGAYAASPVVATGLTPGTGAKVEIGVGKVTLPSLEAGAIPSIFERRGSVEALPAARYARVLVDPPPIVPPIRQATGGALRDALKATGQSGAWQMAVAGQSADTQDRWATTYRETVAITATKLVRIAGACVPLADLDKLFKAAGA